MTSLGAPLDEWQDQALEAAMGERSDGRWASKYVGMSAARQQGKSQILVARALAGVLLFGEKTIIISAHETDTAREVWKRLIDIVEANRSVESRVTGRMDAINREFLSFGRGHDRQTIKLKARRTSGTRGFSADCLLLDEAQILGKRAWGSINPTMSARPNPQLWLFGTPPTEDDDAYAFTRVRESALKKAARHCWLEWSPEPDADINDPIVWAACNPSLGVRISMEAIEDDRSAMDDDQFAQERLGRWDADIERSQTVFPRGAWERAVTKPPAGLPMASLAVSASRDLDFAAIVATAMDGETVHVRPMQHGPGTGWVVDKLRELQQRHDVTVCMDSRDPAAMLIPTLEREGVRLRLMKTADVYDACGGFYSGVVDGLVRHSDYPELNAAVTAASRPSTGERWIWRGVKPGVDISMLRAATFAAWAAANPVEVPVSAYEDHDLMVLS